MRGGWSATAIASAGACIALLLGCGETEPDPVVEFPMVGGGASGSGASPSDGSGVGAAASETCGVHEPSSCPTDALPAPVPSGLGGDITEQVTSDGCGKDYTLASGMKRTLLTQGTKAPDCADELDGVHKCGDWTVRRDFWVYLPANYDPLRPYQLVIEAPGCSGSGGAVPSFGGDDGTRLRVGISPGPNSTGHPTNPNYGCFDDSEGDDSIDWVFYERLYDTLNAELCFDRRRVFASGNGSGGALANELGCKYAGDTVRPVRGVLVADGYLPAPQYLPTCTSAPVAQMWVVRKTMTAPQVFDEAKLAIASAMAAAQCPGGDYDHAQLEDFYIGGGQPDNSCRRIVGCDPLYPLVVCPMAFAPQQSLGLIADPGFSTFTRLFGKSPLSAAP